MAMAALTPFSSSTTSARRVSVSSSSSCFPASQLHMAASSEGKCTFSPYLSRNKPCRVRCSPVVKVEDGVDDETCELVSGADLLLGDGTNAFHAYLLKAVKNNNGTGLLILSDVYGFEASSTRDFAYRVACNGFNVLVPDLFRGNPWVNERNRSEFDKWVSLHPAERVATDISTSANWMIDEFLAAGISKKMGIIGFCFGGGRLIDILARDQGAIFSTGVCFYGTHMDQSVMSDIRVPVLFICGDSDPLCPIEEVEDSEKRIGRGSMVVVFKGQGHAFVHRPGSPEADKDAEEAFMIMRNWLHEYLIVSNKKK